MIKDRVKLRLYIMCGYIYILRYCILDFHANFNLTQLCKEPNPTTFVKPWQQNPHQHLITALAVMMVKIYEIWTLESLKVSYVNITIL